MKTLDELALLYGTDKSSLDHNYTETYDRLFHSLRNAQITLLEIGVSSGASLKMWLDYFPLAHIVGFDIEEVLEFESDRMHIFKGNQSSRMDLSGLIKWKYDIIIDDGSHKSHDQQIALGFLFPYLKSGGIFIIEDLGTRESKDLAKKDRTKSIIQALIKSNRLTSQSMTNDEILYLTSNIKKCVLVNRLAIIYKK